MANQWKRGRLLTGVAAVAIASLTVAGCGGGGGGSNGGSSSGNSKGPITFVTGKDNSGVWAPMIAKWNKAHPKEKVTLKEQTDQADQQHDDIVQHMQAKDPGYDIVTVDVIWTAEFAAKGWLQPLTGDYKFDTTGFLPPTVKAATYNNTLYAAPWASDGGLLYYRKDLVKTPPKTLDEMWKDCKIAKQHNMSCYAGQFAKYEGLTVNATEAINTYGGQVVDSAGKPTINSPQAKQGLQMLVDHVKNGDIPKQESTFQEEQGRIAFEAGKFLFLRNWPYVYNLAKTDGSSKVKDKFGVAPLPGVNGPGASSLGGHSEAISTYSDHKQTALEFLKFITDEAQQKFIAQKGSLAPVRASLYDDPALIKQLPYLPTLKTAIANAVPRPVTPFYPAVTDAIETNAFAAMWNGKPVDQAISDMQKAMQSASSGG
jgi:multiple sugar transport system substrate-binding protein